MNEKACRAVAKLFMELGKLLFPRGYLSDVYVWMPYEKGLSIAWVMEPLKLRRLLDYEAGGKLPFNGIWATRALASVGLKYRQLDDERGRLDVPTFLDHMANALWSTPLQEHFNDFHVSFIPLPGYPWPHPYCSAKRGMVAPERPAWLLPDNVVDPGLAIDSPGVNFCELSGPLGNYDLGATTAVFGRGRDDYFLVTHAMGTMADLTRKGSWEENARAVNDCGGLLFPSLAVGTVPAVNFGPFVLIADVGVVLRSLKPYRDSKAPLYSYVYDTDVWSMTTGTFFREAAVAAFEQLTGQSRYESWLDLNVWPLGTPQAPELHGSGMGTRLERLPQLVREVKARRSIYKRGLTPQQMAKVFERVEDTRARYPYLEAKANGVMPIESFPLAAGPAHALDGFKSFLRATGFRGQVVPVELPSEIAEVMAPDWFPEGMDFEERRAIQEWANLEYAWHVADAVKAVGRATGV